MTIDGERIGSRRSKWRWIIGLSLLLTLGLASALVWQLCQPPAIATQVLPDGSKAILHAVTTGATHTLDRAPPLPRRLQQLGAPLRLPSLIKVERSKACTLAWIERVPAGDPAPGAPPQRWDTPDTVHWEDEHGCRMSGPWDIVRHGSPGGELFWLEQPSAPSRSWIVRGMSSRSIDEAEFEFGLGRALRDRQTVSASQGPTAMAPKKAVTAHLEATLRYLELKEIAGQPIGTARIEARERSGPRFRWDPVSITATDSRGAVAEPYDIRTSGIWPDGIHFPTLCRVNTPWRLTVRLAPNAWDGKTADVRWGTVRVKIEAQNEASSHQRRFNIRDQQGFRLAVQDEAVIANSGSYPEHPKLEAVMISLGLEKTPSDIRIAVSRVNGLTVREWFRRAGLPPQGAAADFPKGLTGQVGMTLPNPRQARTLDLEFVGYQQSEQVEFIIHP